MTENKPKEPNIDWDPAPGYLLCKQLKREEVAALYNRSGGSNLSLPDKVGKVSDSVGVGLVVKAGAPDIDSILKSLDLAEKTKLPKTAEAMNAVAAKYNVPKTFLPKATVGDYVAWMPFTDQIIEIDGAKFSLVGYDKIRAVRKGEK